MDPLATVVMPDALVRSRALFSCIAFGSDSKNGPMYEDGSMPMRCRTPKPSAHTHPIHVVNIDANSKENSVNELLALGGGIGVRWSPWPSFVLSIPVL